MVMSYSRVVSVVFVLWGVGRILSNESNQGQKVCGIAPRRWNVKVTHCIHSTAILLWKLRFFKKNIGHHVKFCQRLFSKAFDRIWHDGLIYKIKTFGIFDIPLKRIENFLSNRYPRGNRTIPYENLPPGKLPPRQLLPRTMPPENFFLTQFPPA